jgi:outer membrane protein TolC
MGQVSVDLDSFLRQIKRYHPLAMGAQIQPEIGDAYVLKARGGFDPKLAGIAGQKSYKGTNYYQYSDGMIKWQSPLAISLETGFEQTGGVYLNPEQTTPADGLFRLGASLPIGQGLFIDQARAEMRKARLYQTITTAEQQLRINQLMYQATAAYLEWLKFSQIEAVYSNAYQITLERLSQVKQSVILGDKPAIDTVEASIQVQNRRLLLRDARMQKMNAQFLVASFIWDEEGPQPERVTLWKPTEDLTANRVIPREIKLQSDSLLVNHPKLIQSRAKLSQLDVDERWAVEQLKPRIDIKYQALTEPINGQGLASFSTNNYQWGLGVAFPILLRKERGNLQLVRLAQQEAEWNINAMQNLIGQELEVAFNTITVLQQQALGFRRIVEDRSTLLEGERTRFNTGESSLFLINSRELNYFKAQVELIKLEVESRKALIKLYYTLGLLGA